MSIPSDTSLIFLVKVIQTRRCGPKKHAKIGRFLKVVIRNTAPELIKRRKKKSRAIVIRTQHYHYRRDGYRFNFFDNALVLLKRRMNMRGKEILGPTSFNFPIKKFKAAFQDIY